MCRAVSGYFGDSQGRHTRFPIGETHGWHEVSDPDVAAGGSVSWAQVADPIHEPYRLDTRLQTRSISFENRPGRQAAGGKAASNLGVGRKGKPSREIKPGETVTLCDIRARDDPAHLADDGARA